MDRPEESTTGDATNNDTSSSHGAGGPIRTRDARRGRNVAPYRSSPYVTHIAPQQREADEVGRHLEPGSRPSNSADGTFHIIEGHSVMAEDHVDLSNNATAQLGHTDPGADGTPHTIDTRGVRGIEPTSSHHYETHNAPQHREVIEVGRHLEPGSSSHLYGSAGGTYHALESSSGPNVIPNVTVGQRIAPQNATTVTTVQLRGRFVITEEQRLCDLRNPSAQGPTGQRISNPVCLNHASANPVPDPRARCIVCKGALVGHKYEIRGCGHFVHIGCLVSFPAIMSCSFCRRLLEDHGNPHRLPEGSKKKYNSY